MENSLFLKPSNTDLFYPPATPLLCIQPKETENHVHTVHSSTLAQTWRHPSVHQLMSIHTDGAHHTTQQQKGRKHWHCDTEECNLCSTLSARARHKRQGILWFHLQEKSRKGKSIKVESRVELPAAEVGMETDCKWAWRTSWKCSKTGLRWWLKNSDLYT